MVRIVVSKCQKYSDTTKNKYEPKINPAEIISPLNN